MRDNLSILMVAKLKKKWQINGRNQLGIDDLTLGERTISKALRKIDYTRKKTYCYRESDEEKRKEFLTKISKRRPEELYI